jgi:hypothetical protein
MQPEERLCIVRDAIAHFLDGFDNGTATQADVQGLRDTMFHLEKLLDPTVTEARAALDKTTRDAVEKYRVNAFLLLLRLVGGSFVFTDDEMASMRGYVVSYQKTSQGNRFDLVRKQ